jgi:hypothetical protein
MKPIIMTIGILLAIFICLIIYEGCFRPCTVYNTRVIGVNVDKNVLNSLETLEHRGTRYSYLLVTNEEDLINTLSVYTKIDFDRFNLLILSIHEVYRVQGNLVTGYEACEIKKRFGRFYINLYPGPKGYRTAGILIPKEDVELTNYIKRNKKLAVNAS